ncbi:winged helix-turn-helix domain-containing protein [uncultured Microbacterium sp.]|uniref:winged helix-turn-helix domain-containing protein n=1 Tax=uncultured Microbacterium sp. TaxID=191216 RepID=UPI00260000D1|nr:crosslink repair DNA glycosylase YcaQ family protein [uncultured Microbacterium sp.]
MTTTLRRADARRIALAAQGFARPRPGTVGTRQITSALHRMRILQIDSVNVFSRSHYMPLFARLGAYDTALLDKLAFARRPSWVESWAHVASLVSVDDWPLLQFRRDDLRAKYGHDAWAEANQPLLQWLRDELADRGPLRPAEIDHDARSGSRGSWWGWDDVKNGLERLWLFGEVAIAGRRGFERRYALASDVLPSEALQTAVPRAQAIAELVRRAAVAYGVATAADLADYWRIRDRPAVMAAIRDLVDDGELIPVEVDGWAIAARPAKAWLHRDAARPRRVDATAILTPFDPVVWFRNRAERLFDFDYRIEIYTPAPQRRFGYYSLPVLVGDDVVGRVDLKADRASSALRVQSAWWEQDAPRDAAERVAAELLAAARWQGLDRVTVSRWGDAAEELAGVLRAERHDHPDGRTN